MPHPELTTPMLRVDRLCATDVAAARTLFATMAQVFNADAGTLSDSYVSRLLERTDFWAMMATVDGAIVGGLTAHALPLTHAEAYELFIYDLAVLPAWQRRGLGRKLVMELRAQAEREGISVAFVPADNEDTHALDFYRAIGGVPTPVTIFTFGDSEE